MKLAFRRGVKTATTQYLRNHVYDVDDGDGKQFVELGYCEPFNIATHDRFVKGREPIKRTIVPTRVDDPLQPEAAGVTGGAGAPPKRGRTAKK